jgi:hypothetical protein
LTRWHADLNALALSPGAEVTVVSHHHVVRVITSDTLLIQGPDGQRQTAVVLDRTAGSIRLALPDGQTVSLELLLDESLQPAEAGAAFSQQKWMTH